MNQNKMVEQENSTLVQQPSAPNEQTLTVHAGQTTYIRHVMDEGGTKLTWKQCSGLVAGTVFAFTVFRQIFGFALFCIFYFLDGAFKSDPESVQALSSLLQIRPDQFFISSLVFTLVAALLVRAKNKRLHVLAALLAGLGPVVPAILNPAPTAAMVSRTPSSLLLLAVLCVVTALAFHVLRTWLGNSGQTSALEVPFRANPE